MVICFNINRETKEKMDSLMKDGQYKDHSEIIEIAVANQFLLHSSADESSEYGEHPATPTRLVPPPQSPRVEPEVGRTAPIADPLDLGPVSSGIPTLFHLKLERFDMLSLAPMPSDAFLVGMDVPVDRWIFGQHNKLLPAKANVRALVNLLDESNKRSDFSLDRLSNEIAAAASQLGDHLREIDAKTGRSRDETLAVAFPSSDPSSGDKSRLRYASQFVGTLSRDGRMGGLLIDLKLINFDRHKPNRLRLTEAGAKLARLDNPILDSRNSALLERFSDEEMQFLIHHIVSSVPVESFAYKATLESIRAGANTPDALDSAISRYLPQRSDKPFTPAFLTTQRAGVIARMSDLGLVARIRQGPNVTYAVTLIGEQLLEGTV